MRLAIAAIAVVLVVPLVGACNKTKIVDECPSGGRTGTAPTCILTAQCVGTNVGVKLDCSANDGKCVCSENGVVGDTVDYKDDFCTPGTSSDFTSLETSLESADDACGWKL